MNETLGFHFEKVDPDKISQPKKNGERNLENNRLKIEDDRTTQEARIWTETSENSRLNIIKHKLSPITSINALKLRNLINKREYVKFQKEIGLTSPKDIDGKLGKKSLEFLISYLNTNRQLSSLSSDLFKNKPKLHDQDMDLAYTQFKERSTMNIQNLSDNIKINRAAKEYLSNNKKLTDFEYNALFSGKEKLKQGRIGNCYLVSCFNSLKKTGYFETLVRTSISRVRFNDDGALGFTVKIPLGEPDGRDILIKDSELSMASLRGDLGRKVLELAYVKNKRPNNKKGNVYSLVTDGEIKATSGGTMKDAFQTLLGHHNIGFCDFGTSHIRAAGKTLSTLSQGKKDEITNYLKNFNGRIGNTFTDLSTAPSKRGDSDSFQVGGKTLYKQHAYSLANVLKDEKGNVVSAVLNNSWGNTNIAGGNTIELSLDEFFHAFSYIGIGKVKVDTFLDDRGDSYA